MKSITTYLGLLLTIFLISVFPNRNAFAENTAYVKDCIYTYQENSQPVTQYYIQVNEGYIPCPEPPLHPNNSGDELHPLFYMETINGIEYYRGVTVDNENCEVTATAQTRLIIGDGGNPILVPFQ